MGLPPENIIYYCDNSTGPTKYYDPRTYSFIEADEAIILLSIEKTAKLEVRDKITHRFIHDCTTDKYHNAEGPNKQQVENHKVDLLKKCGVAIIKTIGSPQKTIIHYCLDSTGPTKYYNPRTYNFIRADEAILLTSIRKTAKLEVRDKITHTFIHDCTTDIFYDAEVSDTRKVDKDKVDSLKKYGVAIIIEGASDGNNDSDGTTRALLGVTAAGATTAATAGAASVPFLAGFTSAGVAAGSTAAGIQAGIGSVAAGSWFAAMQSVAATTLIGTCAPLVVAGAAVAGTAAAGVALHRHLKSKKDGKK